MNPWDQFEFLMGSWVSPLSIEFFVAPPGGELVSHVKGVVVRQAQSR